IGKGRCLVYPFRGMVCRIFGFSALKDKYGNLRLATCSILKKNHPDKAKKAQELLDSGYQAPVITSFSMRMRGINPDLGGKLLPINQAIKAAMEKTSWFFFGEEK
ncbi:MAG: YkgJ family cysteine cluster protein, partial [Candidatus Omnitrophota bacterium]